MHFEHTKLATNNSIYINTSLPMASGDWEFIEVSGSGFHDSAQVKGSYLHDHVHITKTRVRGDLGNCGYKLANDDQVDFFMNVMSVKGFNRHIYHTPDKEGNNVVDRIDWRHSSMKGAR